MGSLGQTRHLPAADNPAPFGSKKETNVNKVRRPACFCCLVSLGCCSSPSCCYLARALSSCPAPSSTELSLSLLLPPSPARRPAGLPACLRRLASHVTFVTTSTVLARLPACCEPHAARDPFTTMDFYQEQHRYALAHNANIVESDSDEESSVGEISQEGEIVKLPNEKIFYKVRSRISPRHQRPQVRGQHHALRPEERQRPGLHHKPQGEASS